MPNTSSAKKAVRSSSKKQKHNLFWKARIKRVVKTLGRAVEDKDVSQTVLHEQLTAVQSVVDKAAKEKVISKNKANRLKSKYATKISARTSAGAGSTASKAKKAKKGSGK